MNKTFKIVLILLVVISILSSVLAAMTFLGKEREYLKRVLIEEKLASVLKDKQRIEKELDEAQKSRETADLRLKELTKDIDELTKELEVETKRADSATDEIVQKQKQILKITEDLEDEKKEKELIAKRHSELQERYEDTKEQLDKVRSEKTKLEKKVTELEQKTVELDKIVVQPKEKERPITTLLLRGKVLVVNRDYNFVVTDLGNDDGVTKGMLFEVQRDSQRLGRVEIDKIYESMSSATMMPGSMTLEIRKGDSVIEVRQM